MVCPINKASITIIATTTVGLDATLLNSPSLYRCLVRGKGITDIPTVPRRMLSNGGLAGWWLDVLVLLGCFM